MPINANHFEETIYAVGLRHYNNNGIDCRLNSETRT